MGEASVRLPGLVRAAEVYTHTFIVWNETSESLEVAELRRSCGCTEARLDLMVLEPGASGRLDVLLDTLGKSGTLVARVDLLDPEGRSLGSVTLSAVVEEGPRIFAAPAVVELPPSDDPHGVEFAELQVILERQRGYAKTEPEWHGALFQHGSIVLLQVARPEVIVDSDVETWIWAARISAGGVDLIEDVLRAQVHDGRQLVETRIAVRRPAGSWFSADATSFFAGVLSPGASWSTTIAVRRLECELESVRLEASADWLTARFEPGETGTRVLRLGGVPPASAVGPLIEAVKILCEGQPTVSLPVRGIVK